jgi:hypothetical protein
MVRRLAHRLLTCFGDPVGLGALASACFSSEATIEHRLEWLDRCVNPLGLEAVMVGDDACAMRLCASTLRLAAARP